MTLKYGLTDRERKLLASQEAEELRFRAVIRELKGTKAYTSEDMAKDWEVAITLAALLADHETEWRHRLLDRYMTRIRAGVELGIELKK